MDRLIVAIITNWRSGTGIGLIKEKMISRWQGVCIMIGLLLLNNPDIEFISSIGAVLMCTGYIPWGVKLLKASCVFCCILTSAGND